MRLEVEQKFAVADRSAIVSRLQKLGARLGAAIDQRDEYFAHPARDFAHSDEALRLRSVGNSNFITYKGPKLDAQTKTRREIELPIQPGEAGLAEFGELLAALGFRSVAQVCKHRQTAELEWQGFNVEIALDEVQDVGQFIELEIVADDAQLESARQAITTLASELSLGQSERRSYLELLLARRANRAGMNQAAE